MLSATGTKASLEAMRTNEKLTNKKYGEAVGQDFAKEVMKLLRINLAQEQQHLAYIEEILAIPRRELGRSQGGRCPPGNGKGSRREASALFATLPSLG